MFLVGFGCAKKNLGKQAYWKCTLRMGSPHQYLLFSWTNQHKQWNIPTRIPKPFRWLADRSPYLVPAKLYTARQRAHMPHDTIWTFATTSLAHCDPEPMFERHMGIQPSYKAAGAASFAHPAATNDPRASAITGAHGLLTIVAVWVITQQPHKLSLDW